MIDRLDVACKLPEPRCMEYVHHMHGDEMSYMPHGVRAMPHLICAGVAEYYKCWLISAGEFRHGWWSVTAQRPFPIANLAT